VAAASTVANLTGCMVGPDYQAPQTKLKPAFTETQAPSTSQPASTVSTIASAPVEWWTTFRDSELSSLIQRAAKQNLSLKQAASRVRQARFQRGVVGSDLLPNINADGGYQRARGSQNLSFPLGALGGGSGGSTAKTPAAAGRTKLTPPHALTPAINEAAHPGGPQSPLGSGGFPGVDTDLYELGFDSTWEIDVFGGSRRALEAATDDAQASQEDHRDILVSTFAEIARNYVELRGLQRQFQIAQKNLDAQQQTLDLTSSRFKAGFVTNLDVTRQETQVDNTAAALPALDDQIRAHIHTLSVLVAEDPNALSEELTPTGPIPAVPPEIPIGLPSDLLRRRPDVRRAERQLAAATARIGQAEADLLPKFSITGALGFDSNKPKSVFDWSSKYWTLSPGVSWSLFDAGRISFNIKVNNEQQSQASDNYQLTVLNALKDVEDALVSYRTEQQRHEQLAKAAAAAHQSVLLANQQYEQGITDFISVLDAERDEFGTEDSLAQSDRAISTNLIALYKALGGGWEVILPEQRPE
jgi:multidrug efflux system outer membrane protein